MQSFSTEEIFKKIHEIDQRLQYMERRETESLRHTQQTVQSISEQARTASTSVANLEMKMSKDLQFLEETLTREVQVEAQRRSENESRLRQQLLDEAVVVRSSLERNERTKNSEVEQALQSLSSELHAVCGRFEKSLQQLEAHLAESMSNAHSLAAEAERKIQHHKSLRETAEMHLLQVLEETCVELHNEIVQERQERIESNKRLERLLLETTSRQWVRT